MKIGILGGTFNPIHIGHLLLAEAAREKLSLDKIFFIPVYLPPHKEESDLISASHRFKMVRLAIKGNPYFDALDTEIKRKGKSYSVDTLNELRQKYPSSYKFFFIVGSDALTYLRDWKDIDALMKLAKFVVASRPGYPLKDLPVKSLPLVIDSVDISGFRIRQRIKNKESVRYLLPAGVHNYIIKNGLYQ